MKSPRFLLLAPLVMAMPLSAAPAKKTPAKAAPVRVPLQTVSEGIERAFTVKLPKGWRNQVYLARQYQLFRSVITSLSPDGQTLLFAGDPRLPNYNRPLEWTQTEGYQIVASFNPLVEVRELEPARSYFAAYTRKKFGHLPNFRLQSVSANPGQMRILSRSKAQAQHDAARVRFSYTDGSKKMNALLNGSIMFNDTLWLVDVSGITTSGDPLRYDTLLFQILGSFATNPQWQQQQQALHNQRMAQLQQDHQNQLARWGAANKSHELRMQAIQDAGNASMKNWYQNQAKSDAAHRAFLNTITQEKTVVSPSGTAYQVDNSYQNYFLNKHTQTYIGTNGTRGLEDLRALGLDPSDYQPLKVKR